MQPIIEKILRKETLTEDDYTALRNYKAPNIKALEDTITDLKAKLAIETSAKDKHGSEMDEFRKQISELTKTVNHEKSLREAAEKEAKAIKRAQTIDGLRAKHGINFIEGIDPEITRGAFAKVFDGIEDFSDEAKITAAVDGFRKANSGIIRAASGAGGSFGGTPINPSPTVSNTEAMAKALADAGVLRSPAK